MKARRMSVAMTDETHDTLRRHLIREDGDEDLCLAMYASSTGTRRETALIREACLPLEGEREVHGNATITGKYVLRVAREARNVGLGVVILHSHPHGKGWQDLSDLDAAAEAYYAHLIAQVTGLPLIGMTLAGVDEKWSARQWSAEGNHVAAESVRIVGARLQVSWNERLVPVPSAMPSQFRTVSAWGDRTHADIARLRVLVVGSGSVGMDVAIRLAATGIQRVGVMDFDEVEEVNRDRLVAATRRDARLRIPKVDVAQRACVSASTSADFQFQRHHLSVTDLEGQRAALDYDVIFSCVDRPWPRAVLNQIAYTDLIPVIDGGIGIDTFDTGEMRNATFRTHVVRPGRPCLQCNGQLDPAQVSRDRLGLFDDPTYIEEVGRREAGKQNVTMLSASVMASQLALFVSLVASPSKFGEPGPLRFSLTTHRLEHVKVTTNPACVYENLIAQGDKRIPLTLASATSPPAGHGIAGALFGLATRYLIGLVRWLFGH
ncbi:ThiF family adenylyltransferase [Sinomonas sp. ASV322]|uniref:ThiF family adenylyltransferase n=1 Tax=Sinomonas sp. ASV322 TaxID=3041920 RepID=UPI0027DE40AE|nr:ThiF family adenylyltransferase [Sinomonas sp. ASV322]MDQ4500747.1 ThiF family adenylyltransferase [Sinomonas sp. ASV322]